MATTNIRQGSAKVLHEIMELESGPMKDLTIHTIHRRLAEAAYMHMNHTTGRIKVENIPIRLLELLLQQNYMLIRQYDELHELSMVAYTAGDMDWLHNICEAIEFLKDESLTKKGW